MSSSTVCKYWQRGNCKFGDNCHYDHPRNLQNRNDGNRFAPLNDSRSHSNNPSRNQGSETRDRPRNQERYVDPELLRKDLTNERPNWILSCYGVRNDMPKNLFGGSEREMSPEEMRCRFYELASQGQSQQALDEAETLHRNATKQMDNVLRDIPGAIKYLQNGFNEHPNRIDICEECSKTGIFVTNNTNPDKLSDNTSGPFGRPFGNNISTAPMQSSSISSFGQASNPASTSAFGVPSKLGSGPVFGQASNPVTGSAFGLPSKLGSGAAFGQSGFSQTPTQSSFGRTSIAGANETAFGQPSGLGPRSSPFGQASQATAAPFGQPSNPFLQQAQQPPTRSGLFTAQPTNQVNMQMSPISNQNPFNASSNSSANSSSFQQPNNVFSSSNTPRFGQPSSSTTTFGQASGGGSGANSSMQGFSTKIQASTNGISNSAVRGTQGKLQSWKGKRVQYFNNEPCYQEDNGSWQRIWFPDEPPAWNKPEILPTDIPYDRETEERFKLAKDTQQFGYGLIPLIPPKREWIDWDF